MRTILSDSAALTSSILANPYHKTRRCFFTGIALVSALSIAIYGRTIMDLVADDWSQQKGSQGLLIVLLASWLAWRGRKAKRALAIAPSPRGLLLIGTSSATFLVGKLGSEFFLQRLAPVILIAGLIWTFWGIDRLRRLAAPLLLLAAAIPLPMIIQSDITYLLQIFTSEISTDLIRLCGSAAVREGNIIHLNHVSLGLEEACSGLNGLSTLVLTSLVVSVLQHRRLITRSILLVASVPIALGVNVVRITGTALIADRHEQVTVGALHAFSGWVVFLLGLAALMALSHALRSQEQAA